MSTADQTPTSQLICDFTSEVSALNRKLGEKPRQPNPPPVSCPPEDFSAYRRSLLMFERDLIRYDACGWLLAIFDNPEIPLEKVKLVLALFHPCSDYLDPASDLARLIDKSRDKLRVFMLENVPIVPTIEMKKIVISHWYTSALHMNCLASGQHGFGLNLKLMYPFINIEATHKACHTGEVHEDKRFDFLDSLLAIRNMEDLMPPSGHGFPNYF